MYCFQVVTKMSQNFFYVGPRDAQECVPNENQYIMHNFKTRDDAGGVPYKGGRRI